MTESLLLESVERIFADASNARSRDLADSDAWPLDLWRTIEDAGLTGVSVPEANGGSGGTVEDAAAVLIAAGRHAAAVPLAECLLAGWMLARGGLSLSTGPTTIVPGLPRDDIRLENDRVIGTAHRVPWGRLAERILVLVEDDQRRWIVSVAGSSCEIEPSDNLAGEPRDTVYFNSASVLDLVEAPRDVTPLSLRVRGALTRAALMSGALERLLQLSSRHAGSRLQFGRRIDAFQAVQAHLVTIAQQSALSSISVVLAARCLSETDAEFEVAASKITTNLAATVATASAHQIHGAIGMTKEYDLNLFTKRLWSWRSEFGDSPYWRQLIGSALRASGPDSLYPVISGGSRALGSQLMPTDG